MWFRVCARAHINIHIHIQTLGTHICPCSAHRSRQAKRRWEDRAGTREREKETAGGREGGKVERVGKEGGGKITEEVDPGAAECGICRLDSC